MVQRVVLALGDTNHHSHSLTEVLKSATSHRVYNEVLRGSRGAVALS